MPKKKSDRLERGGVGKVGVRICLPLHCLSAQLQLHCHTNAISPPSQRTTNCAPHSLASTLLAFTVVATPYCHPCRHANVGTPFLLPLFKPPEKTMINISVSSPGAPLMFGPSGSTDVREYALFAKRKLLPQTFHLETCLGHGIALAQASELGTKGEACQSLAW